MSRTMPVYDVPEVKPVKFEEETMTYKRITGKGGLKKVVPDRWKNMQLEINKFADATDIYKIIQRYEAGDDEALNKNRVMLNNGTDILDLTFLPDNINEANLNIKRLKEQIEQIQKTIESKKEKETKEDPKPNDEPKPNDNPEPEGEN